MVDRDVENENILWMLSLRGCLSFSGWIQTGI